VLAEALELAGWSPRDLVRAINPRLNAMGQPGMDPTAGHGWLRGGLPRSPAVRDLAAVVLSQGTGRQYTSGQLWGRGHPAPEPRATEELLGPMPLQHVLTVASAWTSGAVEPALVHPASAGHLTAAVWDATRQPQVPSAAGRGTGYVPPEYVDMLEEQLASLRRLDDRTGGGPLSQRHARIALHEAVTLIHTGRYTAATGNRLLRHAAGTAQLAGWLSFDAMLDPAAHRYLLLAIRIARAAGDTDMVANALGMLAYQHAASGTPDVALRFAHAAVEQSARSVPVVRARAWGRLATACASAGDLPGFQRAIDRCRHYLGQRRPDDPPSLYYLTPQQVDAECGQALVDIAQRAPGRRPALLAEAAALLSPIAAQGAAAGYRRSGLLHGIHLIRAGILARDTEATAHWAAAVAGHIPHVQSIRCRSLLGGVSSRARRQLTAAGLTDALEAVHEALSGV
jgi:hypothetical protein